jgi:hypothetical protein
MTRLASLAAVSAIALLGVSGAALAEDSRTVEPQVLSVGQLDGVSAGRWWRDRDGEALATADARARARAENYADTDTFTSTFAENIGRVETARSVSSSFSFAD